jgi:hypothetical protein
MDLPSQTYLLQFNCVSQGNRTRRRDSCFFLWSQNKFYQKKLLQAEPRPVFLAGQNSCAGAALKLLSLAEPESLQSSGSIQSSQRRAICTGWAKHKPLVDPVCLVLQFSVLSLGLYSYTDCLLYHSLGYGFTNVFTLGFSLWWTLQDTAHTSHPSKPVSTSLSPSQN